MTAPEVTGTIVKQGRRAVDWVFVPLVFAAKQASNIFQIWKDERGAWSTRRILLWFWTILGAWALWTEVTARVYVVNETIITPRFLSNAWIQAWMVTEGAFIVAVFGPVVADYLKNAAPSITAIGTAIREKITDAQPTGTPAKPAPTAPTFGGKSR